MNILVTGSSSGIGETVARRFVHAGHHVILMARRTDLLVKIVDELNSGGQSNAVAAAGDVGVWNDCLRVVETGIAAFGHIDGLVNAAGGWVVVNAHPPMHEGIGNRWHQPFREIGSGVIGVPLPVHG